MELCPSLPAQSAAHRRTRRQTWWWNARTGPPRAPSIWWGTWPLRERWRGAAGFTSSASEVTMGREEEAPYPVSQCTRCLRWVSPDQSRPLCTPGCLRPGCWRRAGPCGRSSSSPRRPCLPRSNERGRPFVFFCFFFGKTNICWWFSALLRQ